MPLILGDKSVLHFIQFIPLYQKRFINKIIFPREVYVGQNNTLKTLLKYGVRAEDIFITERLTDSVNLSNFMSNYFSSPYMPYLEFRIADHCNMNCKACAEFSGLVKKPHFPDLKKFTQDFERLMNLSMTLVSSEFWAANRF